MIRTTSNKRRKKCSGLDSETGVNCTFELDTAERINFFSSLTARYFSPLQLWNISFFCRLSGPVFHTIPMRHTIFGWWIKLWGSSHGACCFRRLFGSTSEIWNERERIINNWNKRWSDFVQTLLRLSLWCSNRRGIFSSEKYLLQTLYSIVI